MLYICIPAYNESTTIGVLLWRIRKVFQGYSREYEIVVYDDGSNDGTGETLLPYSEVIPLTVIRADKQQGYGHALDVLAREVARRTKYPRRDAMIVMQADFTDQPEDLPELIKRFEGGADIVVTERDPASGPQAARRLRQLAPWALRFFVPVSGIDDPFSSFRLIRISLLREMLKSLGEKPIVQSSGWAANVELLMQTMPLARRMERVTLAQRYDVRARESRIRPFADAMAIYRFAKTARGRRIAAPAVVLSDRSNSSAPARDAVV
ncbi:MAG: glycosyltransferase family 2 protein [Gemmatimonadaceae bacterium]|nr:glycosyltransferase family 2 protein [Gemmatimonadaceae bacterium]MDQ3244693.1 glycosyltransferase family 2 protein [Gemmatimonadota bacterium]